MNKISQIVWFVALGMLACYGLTLSWVLQAAAVVCVVVAGLSSLVCAAIDGGVKWRWLDGVVLASLGYFGWRQVGSPVWDLAKEDLLLMALGVVVYGAFRVRPMGGMVVTLLAGFTLWNGYYFILQKMGGNPWVPMDDVCRLVAAKQNYGLFARYGTFGNAMAISGVVLLATALWGRMLKCWVRWPLAVLAIGALLMGLLSGSRSAVLSVAVAALVMCVIGWIYAAHLERGMRVKVHGLIVMLGLAGTVTIGILGLQSFRERAGADEELLDRNIRTEYWGMAVEQVLEAPLFGTGARSFSYECYRHWDDALSTSEANPEFVHNEYLQLWADYGLIGFVLVLVVLMGHWVLAFHGIFFGSAKAGADTCLRMAGILGLTVVCIHSVTDFPLRMPWNMVLAAICLAWCRAGDRGGKIVLPAPWARGVLYPGMFLAMLAVGGYAGKEVWAGEPLLEVRQVREDGYWVPDVGALYAHEKANERSADFRRSLHIGYLSEQVALGDAEHIQRAEASYREALGRHPYLVEARTRLAILLMNGGQYEAADAEFSQAEELAASRDWWLKFYLNWAINEVMRGDLALSGQRDVVAENHFLRASELVQLGSSEALHREILLGQCYERRICILLNRRKYDDAQNLLAEMSQKVSVNAIANCPDHLLGILAEHYTAVGWDEWMKDRPKLAKSLYETAQTLYVRDRQATKGINAAATNVKLEEIRQVLEVLK